MRTLKFKAQPTNAFFAAVNQMCGVSSKLLITAENSSVVQTVLNEFITARTTVVSSWEESLNTRVTVAKNAFVTWAPRVIARSSNGVVISECEWQKQNTSPQCNTGLVCSFPWSNMVGLFRWASSLIKSYTALPGLFLWLLLKSSGYTDLETSDSSLSRNIQE